MFSKYIIGLLEDLFRQERGALEDTPLLDVPLICSRGGDYVDLISNCQSKTE